MLALLDADPETAGANAAPAAAAPLCEDLTVRVGRRTIALDELDAFVGAPPGEALRAWFGRPPASGAAVRAAATHAIAAIDAALSTAVDRIIAHPRFRALEAAWRGVAWLARGLPPDGMTRLRLLDARWGEIARDLERAPEFDRSALFLKIYEDEFGTPGGTPFALIVGLNEVRHRPAPGFPVDDVTALRQLSHIAAAAFAPMVFGAAPALFGADAHGDLDLRRSVASTFRQIDYTRLQSLQSQPDSRFIALVAPRILLRAPWRREDLGDLGWIYPGGGGPLWGSGALAVAHLAIRAHNDHRWPAAIVGTVRDEIAGGLITGLPETCFETDRAGLIVRPPIELNLSDGLERELLDAGIIALRRVKDTPWLAAYALPSLHRPMTTYTSEAARANDRLGAMLNYILCVSRFAHYVKVIGRDLIGSLLSAADVERRLQKWLNGFTTQGDRLSSEMQARYPLREARIRVADVAGRSGALECTVWLKPHFGLDQAVSEFQLVTVVAQDGAGVTP